MENFIQKIFEIDNEADKYKKSLDIKKNALLRERKEKFEELDNQYLKVLEDERNNLKLRLNDIENRDNKELDEYKKKSEEIKKIFLQKKSELVEQFAKSILEDGD